MPEPVLAPFRVRFVPEAIDDLRGRLNSSRWPDRETVDDWSQGVPLDFIRDLAEYWCDHYDFEAVEERLNAWPQFTTPIDDLHIHFLHARSPEPAALPLVMSHGWPGTFVEFLEVLGPLTDPRAHGGSAVRRIPCRLPVSARVRIQRQARHNRTRHPLDSRGVAHADGSARVRALRRAGRRLG